jgi:hypothetical protein
LSVAAREEGMDADGDGDALDDPETRRRALVRAVVEARRTETPVAFEGAGHSITYADRTLRLEAGPDERDRLDELLSEYRVFKVKQPETRKADPGVVHLSAVTDPKHAADFLEALFRTVYGADEGYELRVAEP